MPHDLSIASPAGAGNASLTSDLDPLRLLNIGRALEPLREQGVLILGSGYSYHNMRGFFAAMRGDRQPTEDSRYFDERLAESLSLEANERQRRLLDWTSAPRARACHPREEHLMPLFVCLGAALESKVDLRILLSFARSAAARFVGPFV